VRRPKRDRPLDLVTVPAPAGASNRDSLLDLVTAPARAGASNRDSLLDLVTVPVRAGASNRDSLLNLVTAPARAGVSPALAPGGPAGPSPGRGLTKLHGHPPKHVETAILRPPFRRLHFSEPRRLQLSGVSGVRVRGLGPSARTRTNRLALRRRLVRGVRGVRGCFCREGCAHALRNGETDDPERGRRHRVPTVPGSPRRIDRDPLRVLLRRLPGGSIRPCLPTSCRLTARG
jgi:hypothetical protein